MTKKLTIILKDSTAKKASDYANSTGRSLSELIENHLENLIEHNNDKEQLSPKLKRLAGIVTFPENFNEKEELHKYFEAKYL